MDDCWNKRLPPKGFEYPIPGDLLVFEAKWSPAAYPKDSEIIPAGTVCAVTESRLPVEGKADEHKGCVIKCPPGVLDKRGEGGSNYHGRIVVPWDVIGNPATCRLLRTGESERAIRILERQLVDFAEARARLMDKVALIDGNVVATGSLLRRLYAETGLGPLPLLQMSSTSVLTGHDDMAQ